MYTSLVTYYFLLFGKQKFKLGLLCEHAVFVLGSEGIIFTHLPPVLGVYINVDIFAKI